jgi:hypothetical protein
VGGGGCQDAHRQLRFYGTVRSGLWGRTVPSLVEHIVAKEEGFFNVHRWTIEKKLQERGLCRVKSTKKLRLTDVQKAQRYELALSRKD